MTDEPTTQPDQPPTSPAPTGEGFLARRKKRHRLINTIAVLLTLLIVGGVVFWLTAFHFYNVGSNSMAPALLATERHKDRLLCWNLAFHYRKPKRWEIVTFETPQAAVPTTYGGMATGGEVGLTVKRLVGLENEHLAIAGGDIWTRPLAGGAYELRVKPDSVQRGMWIEVYKEDFSDVNSEEFLRSWALNDGGSAAVTGNRTLALADGTELKYLPMVRVGSSYNKRMLTLPGIPDRYILPQEMHMRCESCETDFVIYATSQKVRGRCPNCGFLNEETSVVFYQFRSGLPEIGRYHSGDVPQGDQTHFRGNSFYFVSDLKVTMEVRPAQPSSRVRIELHGANRVASADLGGGEALINERPLGTSAQTPKPGAWTRVEFYVVEGTVRLFLGSKRTPVFDRAVWRPDMPEPDFEGGESGIVLAASGGEVEIRNLEIDRDVHYFSGRSQGMGPYLFAMDENDSIGIPPGRFLPLGDNTTVSLDGRSWGPVNMALLRGVPLYIWSPEERAGLIPGP